MPENKILRDIQSGKYKDYYIIYNRKSTDDTNNQKNSLGYQRMENLRFAKRENLLIAPITIPRFITGGVITERHSSFKEDELMIFDSNGSVKFNIDRPKFYTLVEYLNKKHFKGVIFLCWDRASRNPTDNNILKKLIKNGVDLRFATTEYDKGSSGALHMDIDGMFAEHHSRVTSEKVTAITQKSREAGLCTYTAPVGYLNEGNMEWKPLDPIRAPLVKRFFELADEGWSLIDIAKWAVEQGFTMPPRRPRRTREEIELDEGDEDEDKSEDKRPKVSHEIRYTTIQAILRNNFYIGLIKGLNGEDIESKSHEALISRELFYRVQEKLKKKNKSKHYDLPLEYPFRKIFICEGCQRSYTPYPKKGILYCQSKCKFGCKNKLKNFNLKKLVLEKVKPIIEKLVFTENELETFDIRLGKDIGILERSRITKLNTKENKKKKLREDLVYIRENKITLLKSGVYSPEELKSEENRLENEISSLITEEQISEEAMKETMRDITKISELLKDIVPLWDFADLYEKEEITRIIFSELLISEKDLKFKLNIGFKPFESRLHSICAQERT